MKKHWKHRNTNCKLLLWLLSFIFTSSFATASVYQWSVPVTTVVSPETNDYPTAFLWIPEECRQVRAVVIGQHNMSEEDLFDRPKFLREMTRLGIAIIWVTPAIDMIFDFHKGAGEHFEGMLNALAEKSGFKELEFAPVIPVGHSACASYPWNFGAWNPGRTLAIISEHGDAPLTNLTGSGRPNPDWGSRTLDGIPGLMIMGEYEWWEDRVQPALNYREKHPRSPVSFLCDAGYGHFDVSDELVDYLCLFIRKAAEYRLPREAALDGPVRLNTTDPQDGWLKERWKRDEAPSAKAAPYDDYQGDKKEAFWYFDKEIARATEKYYARVRGKKEQYIGLLQDGHLLPFNEKLHARIVGIFQPEADGLTFHLNAAFTDTLRTRLSDGHSKGKPIINRICGPAEKVNDTTFTVRFYRMGLNNPRRTGDIWLLAHHPGNKNYKSSVQQFNMRIPTYLEEGEVQTITFDPVPNQKVRVKSVDLKAESDAGLPVYFYVKEGPAQVKGVKLVFTKIPPRTKFPIKVTVVAWQYGRWQHPAIRSAKPVEQSFMLTNE